MAVEIGEIGNWQEVNSIPLES